MKNQCAKTRKVNEPYEIYRNDSGWEWRVLKKYQNPEQESINPYSRWFCAVKSPLTGVGYDLGDVYVTEIRRNAVKIESDTLILHKW